MIALDPLTGIHEKQLRNLPKPTDGDYRFPVAVTLAAEEARVQSERNFSCDHLHKDLPGDCDATSLP